MKKVWHFIQIISPVAFFIFVFIYSIGSIRDFDIWFHLKSGEVIAKQGIIHSDVFAYTTAGREWYPYEWLFQVGIYRFSQLFGFDAIKYLVAAVACGFIVSVYLAMRRLFSLSVLQSLILSFIFYVSIHEFFTPRPHIFAYAFFTVTLILMLLYYIKNKNYLWITLPLTYVWGNMHGSVFLSPLLAAGYAVSSMASYWLTRDRSWTKKAGIFAGTAVVLAGVTILPPLGTTQYRLLLMFYQQRQIISRFIDEWLPLAINPLGFLLYSSAVGITLMFLWAAFVKTKKWKEALFTIPLLPIPLGAYLATRNVVLGYVAMFFLIAGSIPHIRFPRVGWLKTILVTALILILTGEIYIVQQKKIIEEQELLYYPVAAAQFIKQADLRGHMFNEYGYGGYLLYELYPNQKVFYDGRTDLYLCCEIPDVLKLSSVKHATDEILKTDLDKLWNKYDISFVLLRTEKHVLVRKIAHILSEDPSWSLVFWDDFSQLFVRRDGKNDATISKYGTQAATPYEKNPFRTGTGDQALAEYTRMDALAESAKSKNTIGYIYLTRGDIERARGLFERAISINPRVESSYMNLGEIKAHDGDLDAAIALYRKALSIAPDRGLIYIRLGQLTLQKTGDKAQARDLWKTGVGKTVDEDAVSTLQKLISGL